MSGSESFQGVKKPLPSQARCRLLPSLARFGWSRTCLQPPEKLFVLSCRLRLPATSRSGPSTGRM